MADDDSNETEHRHAVVGCAPRGPCAVQSVCSTYARKLTSFYLPPSRLLALDVFHCGAQNFDASGGTADIDRPPASIASEAYDPLLKSGGQNCCDAQRGFFSTMW